MLENDKLSQIKAYICPLNVPLWRLPLHPSPKSPEVEIYVQPTSPRGRYRESENPLAKLTADVMGNSLIPPLGVQKSKINRFCSYYLA